MKQDVWPAALDGPDELIDEIFVIGAAHTLVAPADVEWIGEALLIVGAHVEQNRQAPLRTDAAQRGVERHFSDGNAHAPGALVAQSEDAFAVAYNNAADAVITGVRENLLDALLVGIAQEEAAGLAPNLAELLTTIAHGGRVNDGESFFDVIGDKRIEKRLIAVLEIAHETIFFDG